MTYYDLNRFIDGWMSAYLDGRQPIYDISETGYNLMWEFIANKYNEIKIPNDFTARLHSTPFLNFLYERI